MSEPENDSRVISPPPHPAAATYLVRGHVFTAEEVVRHLTPFLTPERAARIGRVVASRTRSVVPVLEGLYDRGNVSAVIRSAEALGYQEAHVIDTSPHFKQARRVTQGAEKWVDVREWGETRACVEALRGAGYRICVAHLGGECTLRELDAGVKTALVFGNEHAGPSAEMLALADARFEVPMSGFVESFNISVAAALCLYDFRERRAALPGGHGDLGAEDRMELTAAFYLRGIEHAEQILTRFC